jgi:hypothetical protein
VVAGVSLLEDAMSTTVMVSVAVINGMPHINQGGRKGWEPCTWEQYDRFIQLASDLGKA